MPATIPVCANAKNLKSPFYEGRMSLTTRAKKRPEAAIDAGEAGSSDRHFTAY